MNELHDAVLLAVSLALLLVLAVLDRDNQTLRRKITGLELANNHWHDAVIKLEVSRKWLFSELGHSTDAVDEVKQ